MEHESFNTNILMILFLLKDYQGLKNIFYYHTGTVLFNLNRIVN